MEEDCIKPLSIENVKFCSLSIPDFSCTQWKEYVQNKEEKDKKDPKSKASTVSVVPESCHVKLPGTIKSVSEISLETQQSKKLVSKMREINLMNKNVIKRSIKPLEKPSIEDKLRDMYLNDAYEGNKEKDEEFVNFNYLERLVNDGKNYLYLKMFTNAFYVCIRKPGVRKEKCHLYCQGDPAYDAFLNSVTNGDIPDGLFRFDNYYDVLLFNVHVILKIEKFNMIAEDCAANERDDGSNLFHSTYILLKPTNFAMYFVLNKIQKNIGAKNIVEKYKSSELMSELVQKFKDTLRIMKRKNNLNELDYESKFFSTMSSPLYLNTNETFTLDLINLFLRQKTFTVVNALNMQDWRKACLETKKDVDPNIEAEFNQEWLLHTFEHIASSSHNIELDEFLYLDKPPTYRIKNTKECIMTLLSRRRIIDGYCIESNYNVSMRLVEIFTITIMRQIFQRSEQTFKEVEVQYKFPVLMRNGLFYIYWLGEYEETEKALQRVHDFLPRDILNLTCVGNREKLDQYIYSFVGMVSERFWRPLKIQCDYCFNIDMNKIISYKVYLYATDERYRGKIGFLSKLISRSMNEVFEAVVKLSDDIEVANEVEVVDEVEAVDVAGTVDQARAFDEDGTINEDRTIDEDGTFNEARTIDEDRTVHEGRTINEDGLVDEARTIDEAGTVDEVRTIDEIRTIDEAGTVDEARAIQDAGADDDLEIYDDLETDADVEIIEDSEFLHLRATIEIEKGADAYDVNKVYFEDIKVDITNAVADENFANDSVTTLTSETDMDVLTTFDKVSASATSDQIMATGISSCQVAVTVSPSGQFISVETPSSDIIVIDASSGARVAVGNSCKYVPARTRGDSVADDFSDDEISSDDDIAEISDDDVAEISGDDVAEISSGDIIAVGTSSDENVAAGTYFSEIVDSGTYSDEIVTAGMYSGEGAATGYSIEIDAAGTSVEMDAAETSVEMDAVGTYFSEIVDPGTSVEMDAAETSVEMDAVGTYFSEIVDPGTYSGEIVTAGMYSGEGIATGSSIEIDAAGTLVKMDAAGTSSDENVAAGTYFSEIADSGTYCDEIVTAGTYSGERVATGSSVEIDAAGNLVEKDAAGNLVEKDAAGTFVEIDAAGTSVKIDPAEIAFGDVAVSGTSGNVAVPGTSGDAAVSSTSGDVAVPGTSGDVAVPGTSGDAAVPGTSVDAAVPGTSVDAAVPGTSVDAAAPGTSVDAAVPGTSVDVAVPGTSVDVAVPGTSGDVAVPGTSGDVAVPGTSFDVAAPGTSGDAAVPGTSGDAAVPGTSGDVAVPGTSFDVAAPGTSGDAAVPGTSGDAAIPGTSGDVAVPDTSGDAAVPGTSGDVAVPGTSGDVAVPGTSGDVAVPGTSGDVAVPGTSGDVAVPGTSGDAAVLGTSGDAAVPDTSGDAAVPGTSGDAAVPGTSGDFAVAGTSGDFAVAGTSGDFAVAGTSGDFAVAGTSVDVAAVVDTSYDSNPDDDPDYEIFSVMTSDDLIEEDFYEHLSFEDSDMELEVSDVQPTEEDMPMIEQSTLSHEHHLSDGEDMSIIEQSALSHEHHLSAAEDMLITEQSTLSCDHHLSDSEDMPIIEQSTLSHDHHHLSDAEDMPIIEQSALSHDHLSAGEDMPIIEQSTLSHDRHLSDSKDMPIIEQSTLSHDHHLSDAEDMPIIEQPALSHDHHLSAGEDMRIIEQSTLSHDHHLSDAEDMPIIERSTLFHNYHLSAAEDMPVTQSNDKAVHSAEEFDGETMSLIEYILNEVEDVSREEMLSNEGALTLDEPMLSVIKDVSADPDSPHEVDQYGNQASWKIPKDTLEIELTDKCTPCDIESVLSTALTKSFDVQASSSYDSQPVSSDKYLPTEFIYPPQSREAALNNEDILHKVYMETIANFSPEEAALLNEDIVQEVCMEATANFSEALQPQQATLSHEDIIREIYVETNANFSESPQFQLAALSNEDIHCVETPVNFSEAPQSQETALSHEDILHEIFMETNTNFSESPQSQEAALSNEVCMETSANFSESPQSQETALSNEDIQHDVCMETSANFSESPQSGQAALSTEDIHHEVCMEMSSNFSQSPQSGQVALSNEIILHDVCMEESANFSKSLQSGEAALSNKDILPGACMEAANFSESFQYNQPVLPEFGSLPLFPGQHSQSSDTQVFSHNDSVPVTREKPVEDISDDETPIDKQSFPCDIQTPSTIDKQSFPCDIQTPSTGKYAPSVEPVSPPLSPQATFHPTNLFFPQSFQYSQPVLPEFGSLPLFPGQHSQSSDTQVFSHNDSVPVTREKPVEDISDDETPIDKQSFPCDIQTPSTIDKQSFPCDIQTPSTGKYAPSVEPVSPPLSPQATFHPTNLFFPQSYQGVYPAVCNASVESVSSTPVNVFSSLQNFPDLIYQNQGSGTIPENFQFAQQVLPPEFTSFGIMEPVSPIGPIVDEHCYANTLPNLYGNQVNPKMPENESNANCASASGIEPISDDSNSLEDVDLYGPTSSRNSETPKSKEAGSSAGPVPNVQPSAAGGYKEKSADHETGEDSSDNNLGFTGFTEDPVINSEIPNEVPLEDEPRSSRPSIYVSSTVKSGSAETVFEAHEFEIENKTPQKQLTKKESEKFEVYPALHKEFIFDPTHPDHIPDLKFDFKFEKKELVSLKKHLTFLSDMFKPRSIRKCSTKFNLPTRSAE